MGSMVTVPENWMKESAKFKLAVVERWYSMAQLPRVVRMMAILRPQRVALVIRQMILRREEKLIMLCLVGWSGC